MQSASSNAGTPAPCKDSAGKVPYIFEWYVNEAQRNFQRLYEAEPTCREDIVRIYHELSQSHRVHDLVAIYESSVDDAGTNEQAKSDILFALITRAYIAGTLRDTMVLNA